MRSLMTLATPYKPKPPENMIRNNNCKSNKETIMTIYQRKVRFKYLVVKSGLQIGHFEKNSRAKKLKTQGKNSRTQEKNSGF